MDAQGLKQIDEAYNIHLQAWANQRVQATKNIGTEKKPKIVPVYEKFDEFFDYGEAVADYLNESTKEKEVAQDEVKKQKEKELFELIRKANTQERRS